MTDIKFEELNSNLSEFHVVDVRLPNEIVEQGQLPGSHVLPVQELEEALKMNENDFKAKYGFPKLNVEDPSLVITCRSGRRVGLAQEILKAKGFSKHRLYFGSFLDWEKNGGSIKKPGEPFKPEN
ncbi:Thiosulfate sulfurtransferase/rhodanese-like domain-containing protein 3 [Halocaridina rubra]|uniref:Thiosulfate sulfurtransferase/rhodanese-like domain-containing protein 3 n=1 Tax=Halocaridina rubra TaxID=373956 RepID=A0AAN8XHE0_HALRR